MGSVDIENVFKEYRKLDLSQSKEDKFLEQCRYVNCTNRLEGNKLTLEQTIQLLGSGLISGKNIKVRDIYEQRGMFRALNRMIQAINQNEKFSIELVINMHGSLFEEFWEDDVYYFEAKENKQHNYSLKQVDNLLSIYSPEFGIKKIEPLSSINDVYENMNKIIHEINSGNGCPIMKGVKLAKFIWLHQSFIDGNKRLGRLLINYFTMKEGYPLFSYEDINGKNYNQIMVNDYLTENGDKLFAYVQQRLLLFMQDCIANNKK
ncbi:Fic family protein [Marinifilum caeruleilacunae]|uniref:Fido domain-containing protein n=1 Tax=Marinifilum caeruleilacunae TaxID=2499076 RepID=A0ABX1WSC1_9BACT|nr:Fic family protein [Marinifilum caeruleilacunae]NOU58891.1 hypothetical protein [Marinifilum caeruleilacunae]